MIINLCIVILRDINDSSQSSLALAGLAMKIEKKLRSIVADTKSLFSIVNCFRKLYRTVHFIIYIRSQLVVKLP